MHFTLNRKHDEAGFTLVEVGVIVPIILVIGLAMFQIIFLMLQTSNADKARTNIAYEKQVAMNTIESDVRLSSSFLTTNDSKMTDPNQTFSNGGAWSFAGSDSSHRVLILRSYATDGNPLLAGRNPIYEGSGTACTTTNLQYDTLHTYDTIYFVSNSTLYRRRLVDTGTATCTTQYQKLSCPASGTVGNGSRVTTGCGADDEVIATNVSDFEVAYYIDGSATNSTDVYSGDNSAVTGSSSVGVTLAQTRVASGQTVTGTSTLRIATLNTGGS